MTELPPRDGCGWNEGWSATHTGCGWMLALAAAAARAAQASAQKTRGDGNDILLGEHSLFDGVATGDSGND